tara:strand:+ start:275 stop:811 length:537 start_codon:yes stop_codon:yes gene_type:complete
MSTLITTTAQIGTIKDAGGNNTAMTIDSTGRVFQPAKPAWRIGRSTGLAGVNGTTTVLDFDDVADTDRDFFTQGGVTVNSGVVTVPVAGIYHLGSTIRFDNVSSSYIVVRITKNNDANSTYGAYDIVGNGQSTNYESIGDATIFKLNASDTVKIDYYVSNDSSFTIDTRAYFWGYLVG